MRFVLCWGHRFLILHIPVRVLGQEPTLGWVKCQQDRRLQGFIFPARLFNFCCQTFLPARYLRWHLDCLPLKRARSKSLFAARDFSPCSIFSLLVGSCDFLLLYSYAHGVGLDS
jgi:hypothetical protein